MTSNVMGLAGAFLLNIAFARALTVSDRGRLAVALHGVYLVGTFVAGGLERTIGTLPRKYSFLSLVSLVSTITRGRFVVAGVIGLAVSLAVFVFSSPQLGLAALLVTIAGLGNAALIGIKGASLGSGETLMFGAVTIGSNTVILAGIGISLLIVEASWLVLLTAFSVPYLFMAAFVYHRNGSDLSGEEMRNVQRASRQFGVGYFASRIAMRSDRFMLPVLASAFELGRYVVPAGIAEVAVLGVNSVSEGAMPWLTHRQSRGALRLRTLYLTLLGLFLFTALGTFVGLFVLVGPIFGDRYAPSVLLAIALALGAASLVASMATGNILAAMQRSAVVGRSEVIGAVLALLAYIVLIPLFGAEGAAIAATFAYAVTAALQMVSLGRTGSGGLLAVSGDGS